MNWSQYNKNLKKRASLHLIIPDDVDQWWYSKENNSFGRPKSYSDAAVQICLEMRSIFRLPLRQTEGFLESIFEKAGLLIKVPCYTQISRRTGGLKPLYSKLALGENLNIAVDSTGLKVYGEGEWKAKQHGVSKRRVWRKIHIAIDVDTQHIVKHKVTASNVTDASVFNELVSHLHSKAKNIYADGAYDQTKCYKTIHKMGANPVIPPRKNARLQKSNHHPAKFPRDSAIVRIKSLGNNEDARKQWKVENNYHKRSLAETAMFRLKATFGYNLQSRKYKNQMAEIAVKIGLLNKIANLGMPKTF